MAGKLACAPSAEHDSTYVQNLKTAASLLEQNNILGVIEPINKYALPGYYLACYEKGFFSLFIFAYKFSQFFSFQRLMSSSRSTVPT